MCRNPVPVAVGTLTLDNVTSIKRADCSFYNECLDQAIDGCWEGFGCTSCTAYAAMDQEQSMSDVVSLLAMEKAAEMVEIHGRVERKRGVKSGADSRPRVRQAKLVNREESANGDVVVRLAVI